MSIELIKFDLNDAEDFVDESLSLSSRLHDLQICFCLIASIFNEYYNMHINKSIKKIL